jgi:hypothetical protein
LKKLLFIDNFNQRYGRALTQLAGGSKKTAKPGRK